MKPENFSRTLGLECSWRSDRLCRPAVVWSVKALRLRELRARVRAGGERAAPAVLEQRPKTPSTPALSRGSQRPHSQPFVTVAFQGAQPLAGVRGCGWSGGGGRVFVDQLAWDRPPESYGEHFREKVGWARGLRVRYCGHRQEGNFVHLKAKDICWTSMRVAEEWRWCYIRWIGSIFRQSCR